MVLVGRVAAVFSVPARPGFFMAQKRKLVGIDVGSSTVKAVSLHEGPQGIILDRIRVVENPGDPNDLVRLLKSILADFRAQRFALSLPGRFALVRGVSVPAAVSGKLAQVLRMEVQHRIPFPLEQVNWDSCPLPSGGATLDFLVCAVKKDIITRFFAPFYDFGYEMAALDVDPIVLLNLASSAPGYNPEKTCAVLDIGNESSNFVVFRKNLVLVRSLTVNGSAYTNSLKEETGLDTAGAEREKMSLSAASLPASVATVHENLVSELQSSLDYWRLTQKGEPAERLYLTGGGSQVAGLPEALRGKLGLEVERLDPLAGVETDAGITVPPGAGSRLAIAVGLASRLVRPENIPCGFNFVPQDYVKLQINRKNRLFIFLASFVAIIMAYTPSIFFHMETAVRENLIEHLNDDIQEYERHQPRIQDLERQANQLRTKYRDIHGTVDKRYLWLSRLVAVGRVLPGPETYFTSFQPAENSMVLSGVVAGPSASLNFRDFRQLLMNIEDHPFFQTPEITALERVGDQLVFTLAVNLREGR